MVIISIPFQCPKVKKRNCPVGRVFCPSRSRISQFCTYSTKLSPGEDHRNPTPSFHIVQMHKPALCHCKQSQKLATKRCMAPHFSLLSPSFFFILLLNVETLTDRTYISDMHTSLQPLGECHCWWTRVSRGHMKPSSTFDFSWFVAFWEHQNFTYWNSNFVDLLHGIPFGYSFFWYFCDISFQLLKLLCLDKNHWWGFCTRNAHMVHIVNEIRFKMVYTLISIFIFQLFSYFVWLRITDNGSVLEMRIWSILLSLFPYCKSQSIPCEVVAKYMANAHFSFKQGGGAL